MNIQFHKNQLNNLLLQFNVDDISIERMELFFENYTIETKDMLYYYELMLNTNNGAGLMFLKEKYQDNFIIEELIDTKIKYIDLRMKEYQERYFKFCNIFVGFYGTDNKDFTEEIEKMTNKNRRNKFVEDNLNDINKYTQQYEEQVKLYKQEQMQKEENEL